MPPWAISSGPCPMRHSAACRPRSLATAHALRNPAGESPLVIAVDDVQWLDRPSARVLSFALRRFADEPIGVLASLRISPGSSGDLLGLDRAVLATTHLAVGPLAPVGPGGPIHKR